jgi:archaemetzincin
MYFSTTIIFYADRGLQFREIKINSVKLTARYFLLIFVITCAGSCARKNITLHQSIVAIQPLGNFNQATIKFLSCNIQKFYGCRVVVLPSKDIPSQFFDNSKSPRYSADSLLRWLGNEAVDSIRSVLGITEKDIFTTKRDDKGNIKKPAEKYSVWGIFGLGYVPGKACVVSDFRLHCNDRQKELSRLRSITLHEVGHNFGLQHCPDKRCLMTDANESIKTIDHAGGDLCGSCRRKLHMN